MQIRERIATCFLTVSVNPLKIIIQLVDVIAKIEKLHPMLSFKTESLKKQLLDIGNCVIEETAAGDDIEILVQDTLYNGLQVIDMIAYLNLTDLLQSPIMDNIVSQYWEGPYERTSFMNECTNYKVIKFARESAIDTFIGGTIYDDVVHNPEKVTSLKHLGL